METWINANQLEIGVESFPKMSKIHQARARKSGQLEFIRLGREVVYKREWIELYLARLKNYLPKRKSENPHLEADFIQATKEILKNNGSYNQRDLIKEIKQSVCVGDIRASHLLDKFVGSEWDAEEYKKSKIYSLPPKI